MRDGLPLHVVIAGAGRAGLEAMFRLQRLAGRSVRITLLAPNREFSNHALDVLLPFATSSARRRKLETLAAAAGARVHRGRVSAVDVDEHHVVTDTGETVPYDVLLLAIGAVPRASMPRSLCFGTDGSHERMHGLIQDVEDGYVRSVAFVMPTGATWPVALYELALMTAERAFDQCQSCELALLTGEPSPLAIFGAATSQALRDRLQAAGITLMTSVEVEIPAWGQLDLDHGAERLIVDRAVTVPALHGPAVAGVPHDAGGFLVIDRHGHVAGAADVYAAGDVTSGAIKHGSLACRQADAAAEAIAAQAGVALEPTPIAPVLEGVLVTERDALLMRCDADSDAAGTAPQVLRRGAPGWPPTKISGRELRLHLNAPMSGSG
jgi:sulfide:quinone oxidoreductase